MSSSPDNDDGSRNIPDLSLSPVRQVGPAQATTPPTGTIPHGDAGSSTPVRYEFDPEPGRDMRESIRRNGGLRSLWSDIEHDNHSGSCRGSLVDDGFCVSNGAPSTDDCECLCSIRSPSVNPSRDTGHTFSQCAPLAEDANPASRCGAISPAVYPRSEDGDSVLGYREQISRHPICGSCNQGDHPSASTSIGAGNNHQNTAAPIDRGPVYGGDAFNDECLVGEHFNASVHDNSCGDCNGQDGFYYARYDHEDHENDGHCNSHDFNRDDYNDNDFDHLEVWDGSDDDVDFDAYEDLYDSDVYDSYDDLSRYRGRRHRRRRRRRRYNRDHHVEE